jgi:hypothetical protein
MLIRCYKCKGRREYMGAGMIFHKCEPCLGVGFLDSVPDITEPDETPIADVIAQDEIKPKRKYTRRSA